MREYLVVLLVAAAVTYLLTPVARVFALKVGAMTAVRDRDVHDTPTPRLGGLAMYAGVAAAFLVASALPALQSVFIYSDVKAVLVAGGVMVLPGVLFGALGAGLLLGAWRMAGAPRLRRRRDAVIGESPQPSSPQPPPPAAEAGR